jgi:hypothetical protein
MLKKGLILNYDPTCLDEHSATQIELSPTGDLHLYWGKGNFDYLFAMAEATPIRERGTFEEFKIIYDEGSSRSYREFVGKLVAHFIRYMFAEDLLFCRVPAHPSYGGQLEIIKKLESMVAQAVA